MKVFILSATLSLPILASAGSGTPIQHVHGERSHTHSLPDSGRNHSHSTKKKPTKSATVHSHDGRSHSHILPSTGKNHSHTAQKKKTKRKAPTGWTEFASSSTHWLDYKNGSYETTKNKGGDKVGSVIIEWTTKVDKSVRSEKAYVTSKDCLKGYGEVVFLKLDGSYSRDASYVEDGSSMGSSVGDIVCTIIKKYDSKGI